MFSLLVSRGWLTPINKDAFENATDREIEVFGKNSVFGGTMIELRSGDDVNHYYLVHHDLGRIFNVCAFSVGHGIGSVSAEDRPIERYHDRLDMPVSRNTYLELFTWLEMQIDKKKLYGVFNNCSDLAARACQKAGIKEIKPWLVSIPDRLSRKLRKMAVKQENNPEVPYNVTLLEKSFPRAGVK